jgi:hypothetical protein
MSHWTKRELSLLKGVSTFEDLVPIGVDVLRRMREADEHIVQICGPMTTGGRGDLKANMDFFKKAQAVARVNGMHVFDQTPFEEAMLRLSKGHLERGAYPEPILHVVYRGFFATGFIRELPFLPGWQSSVGATWERKEAVAHGILVTDFPAPWLEIIEEVSFSATS